jgi:hypothetical protein
VKRQIFGNAAQATDFPTARPVPGFHSDGLTSHFKLNRAISPFRVIFAITGAFPTFLTAFLLM